MGECADHAAYRSGVTTNSPPGGKQWQTTDTIFAQDVPPWNFSQGPEFILSCKANVRKRTLRKNKFSINFNLEWGIPTPRVLSLKTVAVFYIYIYIYIFAIIKQFWLTLT